jgi:hypothetical protein
MSTSEDYVKCAEECVRRAGACIAESNREILLYAAAEWRMLAKEAGARTNECTPSSPASLLSMWVQFGRRSNPASLHSWGRTVLWDRDKLEKALERAEERIALGEKQIADQKEIITKLERAGQDTVQAKGLLVVFEGTQEINFTVRDILRRQRKQALN